MIHWIGEAFRWTWHDPDGYNIMSGPLPDLAFVGAIAAWLKHHNCKQPRCWRLGHKHPGHGRPVCARHYHIVKEPKP